MKKIFTLFISLFFVSFAYAQWNGSFWSANDMNGTSHSLTTHTNEDKAVLVDVSAHWCPPCFSWHQTGIMEELYHDFGTHGTNEFMVFFLDVDAGSSIPILQGGAGSQGDWVTGVNYPIIGPNGQGALVGGYYTTPGVPTLFLHCGNGPAPEIPLGGDAVSFLSSIQSSCPSAFSFQGADATLLIHDGVAGCPDSYMTEVNLYNASSNTNLTSADIELRDPSGQLIYTENWTGNLNPFARTTVTLNHVLNTAGVYKAKVVNPNGIVDTRPTGDEEEIFVNFGYGNAYWDAPVSIDVSNTSTSWFLKDNTGLLVGSGFGGIIGTNNIFPLVANECYTLQILNGMGENYTITDGMNNIVAQGVVDDLDFKVNFSTGSDPWTSINDIDSKIRIYPNPVNEKLFIEGDYDYIEIFDLKGKKILLVENKDIVDVSALLSGVYMLNVYLENSMLVKKITINK